MVLIAAVEKLSKERSIAAQLSVGDDEVFDENHSLVILLRRCFAHVIRMGFTRGGGYRGGRGSLPRYLLKQGVPPKMMTKMMSIIIQFNYIPDDEVFEEAMTLFCEEFGEYTNKHVREYYLDPKKPKKLGGRAAGDYQGQVGSNQGGEAKGGSWKKKWREIVSKKSAADRYNFLHMVEAVARDCHTNLMKHGDVLDGAFATEPVVTSSDYDSIRKLSKNGWPTKIIVCDWVYLICQDTNGAVISTKKVIGKRDATFTVWIPQSIMYTLLKKMKQTDIALGETKSIAVRSEGVSGIPDGVDTDSKDANEWHKVLVELSETEKHKLKRDLIKALHNHTVERKPWETTWMYLQRMAQRLPRHQSGSRVATDWGKAKSIATLKKEWEGRNEKAKWSGSTDAQSKKAGSKGKQKKSKATTENDKAASPSEHELSAEAMLDAWDEGEVDVDLDEDACIDDWMDILNIYHEGLFGETEKETLREIFKKERVAYPRQLGDWITVKVDGKNETVKCNCERCSRDGKCEYVVSFEVLQFKKAPPTKHSNVEEGFTWANTVKRAVDVIWLANIDV
jgi:hypothetical protein